MRHELSLKSPVRIGILSALVVAAIAGDCGSRPTYLGPGGAGSTTPQLIIPAWKGRDTTATYATIVTGHGYLYNEADTNPLTGGALHRAWSRQLAGWSVGALGYGGRYTLAPRSTDAPGARERYAGLGICGALDVPVRSRHIEWRLLHLNTSLTREWGGWANFRRDVPTLSPSTGQPFQPPVIKVSTSPWLLACQLGPEFVTMPKHRYSPVFGLGSGLALMGEDHGFYGTVQLGLGPVRLYALTVGSAKYQIGSIGQYGLSVALPPYR